MKQSESSVLLILSLGTDDAISLSNVKLTPQTVEFASKMNPNVPLRTQINPVNSIKNENIRW